MMIAKGVVHRTRMLLTTAPHLRPVHDAATVPADRHRELFGLGSLVCATRVR
jgi:hypothetical protein